MKIYSWNAYCYNRKIDQAAQFIESLDFDVLCLQEVTPALLQRLEAMPLHLVSHINVLRFYSQKKLEQNYIVILSKHEMKGHGTFRFPQFRFPSHTRLIIRILKKLKMFHLFDRGGAFADVVIDGQRVRIINAHLALWGPENRYEEFRIATEYMHPDMHNVIAGDFNIIEYPPIKIFNWFLGSSFKQSLPSYSERKNLDAQFKKANLVNPMAGTVTHDFSKSQLDHILIPRQTDVVKTHVVSNLYGSDHHPIGLEIAFT